MHVFIVGRGFWFRFVSFRFVSFPVPAFITCRCRRAAKNGEGLQGIIHHMFYVQWT